MQPVRSLNNHCKVPTKNACCPSTRSEQKARSERKDNNKTTKTNNTNLPTVQTTSITFLVSLYVVSYITNKQTNKQTNNNNNNNNMFAAGNALRRVATRGLTSTKLQAAAPATAARFFSSDVATFNIEGSFEVRTFVRSFVCYWNVDCLLDQSVG